MKTPIKIVIGLVVVLLVAAPYITGRVIEKDYNEMVQNLNSYIPAEAKATVTGKFNRGIFTSTATTEFHFKNMPQSFQLAHVIHHGPLIFNFIGWLHPSSYIPRGINLGVITTNFTGDVENNIQKSYAGKPAYDITTTISFHADVNTVINSYPITITTGPVSLNWQGMQANIGTDIKLDQINANINLPMVEYTESVTPDAKRTAHLEKLQISYQDSSITKVMNVNLSLDSLKVSSGSTNEASVQNYVISFDKKVTKDAADIDFKVSLAKFVMDTLQYGPINIDTQLKNVDADALKDYLQEPEAVFEQGGGSAALLKILNKKVAFDYNISGTTPDGSITLKSHSEIGGPNVKALNDKSLSDSYNTTLDMSISKKLAYVILAKYGETQVQNMEALYYMQNPTSKIKNPYTLAPQDLQNTITAWIKKVLDQMVAQKFLVQNGDILTANVVYNAGALTVNGTPKTDADLQQLNSLMVVIQPPSASSTNTGTSTGTTSTTSPNLPTTGTNPPPSPSTPPASGTKPAPSSTNPTSSGTNNPSSVVPKKP